MPTWPFAWRGRFIGRSRLLLIYENSVDILGHARALGIAKAAKAAVGNDSGPMHVAAVAGTPSVVLYSNDSDPALCAQCGADVTILRRPSLDALNVDDVMQALPTALGGS